MARCGPAGRRRGGWRRPRDSTACRRRRHGLRPGRRSAGAGAAAPPARQLALWDDGARRPRPPRLPVQPGARLQRQPGRGAGGDARAAQHRVVRLEKHGLRWTSSRARASGTWCGPVAARSPTPPRWRASPWRSTSSRSWRRACAPPPTCRPPTPRCIGFRFQSSQADGADGGHRRRSHLEPDPLVATVAAWPEELRDLGPDRMLDTAPDHARARARGQAPAPGQRRAQPPRAPRKLYTASGRRRRPERQVSAGAGRGQPARRRAHRARHLQRLRAQSARLATAADRALLAAPALEISLRFAAGPRAALQRRQPRRRDHRPGPRPGLRARGRRLARARQRRRA